MMNKEEIEEIVEFLYKEPEIKVFSKEEQIIRRKRMNQNMMAKILNASVTGRHFVNEDINNFIYASLSQPPIKIIDKCGSDDEMDYIVECPNCGRHVKYGDETFMLSGHIYCKNEGCRDSLVNKDPYLRELYGKIDKKDES